MLKTIISKINLNCKFSLKVICLFGFFLTNQAHSEIHPISLIGMPYVYSKVYFGMSLDEFKDKLGTKIKCTEYPEKSIGDQACVVTFIAGSELNSTMGVFKNNILIRVSSEINSDQYEALGVKLSDIYKNKPQIEDREEKRGIFSDKINNQYLIWAYPNYLMVLSKFVISRYNKDGANVSILVESDNSNYIEFMRAKSKKNLNISFDMKVENVDLNQLHIPKETPIKVVENASISQSQQVNSGISVNDPVYSGGGYVNTTKIEVTSETKAPKPNLQNFSPKYKGTNIDSILKVAKKLEKELGEKGEYESTAQYEERKNALTEREAKNEVIFVVAPDKVKSKYDADKKIFTLTTGRLTDDNSVSLRYSLKDAGSYIGENAYGVKRRIFKKREYSLEAEFIDFRENPKRYGRHSWVLLGHDDFYFNHLDFNTITADVSSADAFQLKGKIAIAYSGKLIPNFHNITTYDNDRPTITDPIETIQVEEKIYFKVEKIIVFKFNSGEIIKSFDIADSLPVWIQQAELYTDELGRSKCQGCRQPGMHINEQELKL